MFGETARVKGFTGPAVVRSRTVMTRNTRSTTIAKIVLGIAAITALIAVSALVPPITATTLMIGVIATIAAVTVITLLVPVVIASAAVLAILGYWGAMMLIGYSILTVIGVAPVPPCT